MKTTPDNQKLLDLIEYARKGKIVLPQFHPGQSVAERT